MRTCSKCGGGARVEVTAKCSDLCALQGTLQGTNFNYTGYVPEGLGLGNDGDYVEFSYCPDCGQMAGSWPKAQGLVQVHDVEVKDLEEPVKVRIIEGITKVQDVIFDVLTDEKFFEVYGDVHPTMTDLHGANPNGVIEVYGDLWLRVTPQSR